MSQIGSFVAHGQVDRQTRPSPVHFSFFPPLPYMAPSPLIQREFCVKSSSSDTQTTDPSFSSCDDNRSTFSTGDSQLAKRISFTAPKFSSLQISKFSQNKRLFSLSNWTGDQEVPSDSTIQSEQTPYCFGPSDVSSELNMSDTMITEIQAIEETTGSSQSGSAICFQAAVNQVEGGIANPDIKDELNYEDTFETVACSVQSQPQNDAELHFLVNSSFEEEPLLQCQSTPGKIQSLNTEHETQLTLSEVFHDIQEDNSLLSVVKAIQPSEDAITEPKTIASSEIATLISPNMTQENPDTTLNPTNELEKAELDQPHSIQRVTDPITTEATTQLGDSLTEIRITIELLPGPEIVVVNEVKEERDISTIEETSPHDLTTMETEFPQIQPKLTPAINFSEAETSVPTNIVELVLSTTEVPLTTETLCQLEDLAQKQIEESEVGEANLDREKVHIDCVEQSEVTQLTNATSRASAITAIEETTQIVPKTDVPQKIEVTDDLTPSPTPEIIDRQGQETLQLENLQTEATADMTSMEFVQTELRIETKELPITAPDVIETELHQLTPASPMSNKIEVETAESPITALNVSNLNQILEMTEEENVQMQLGSTTNKEEMQTMEERKEVSTASEDDDTQETYDVQEVNLQPTAQTEAPEVLEVTEIQDVTKNETTNTIGEERELIYFVETADPSVYNNSSSIQPQQLTEQESCLPATSLPFLQTTTECENDSLLANQEISHIKFTQQSYNTGTDHTSKTFNEFGIPPEAVTDSLSNLRMTQTCEDEKEAAITRQSSKRKLDWSSETKEDCFDLLESIQIETHDSIKQKGSIPNKEHEHDEPVAIISKPQHDDKKSNSQPTVNLNELSICQLLKIGVAGRSRTDDSLLCKWDRISHRKKAKRLHPNLYNTGHS